VSLILSELTTPLRCFAASSSSPVGHKSDSRKPTQSRSGTDELILRPSQNASESSISVSPVPRSRISDHHPTRPASVAEPNLSSFRRVSGETSPDSEIYDRHSTRPVLIAAEPKPTPFRPVSGETPPRSSQDKAPAEFPTPSQKGSTSLDEIRAMRRRQLAKATQTQSNPSSVDIARRPSLNGFPSSTPSAPLTPPVPGPATQPRQANLPPVTDVFTTDQQNDPPSSDVSTGFKSLDTESGLPHDQPNMPIDQPAVCAHMRTNP